MAKQLSKASTPLCLGSIGVVFTSSKINLYVVRSALMSYVFLFRAFQAGEGDHKVETGRARTRAT